MLRGRRLQGVFMNGQWPHSVSTVRTYTYLLHLREQVDSYLFVDDPTRSRLGENLDGSSEILYRYDDDLYHSQESQAMQGHYSQEEPDDQLPAISIFDADFE